MLEQEPVPTVDVHTQHAADEMVEQLAGLVRDWFNPQSNMGFHSWLTGLRGWLEAQRGSQQLLCWRVPDTCITEVGGPDFVLQLVQACRKFGAVSTCENESHEYLLDFGFSNARIDLLLAELPPPARLQGAATCGEVRVLEERYRMNAVSYTHLTLPTKRIV
eukprot:TRINITY_DN56387_c0_g1_i1.p1 TRINITY_DN56387_c0_g1~~TRINITY_DN56387_c0_g1_i1.p1  ORF type:complete len:162 (-),score=26.91 TRINITY_DN56387_c0_g1_i1:86-571(-)